MTQDWTKLVADLERLLKLRAIPFGMKLFERPRGDGGDPADSPAEGGAHARSDRRAGRSSRLDRRASRARISSARSAGPWSGSVLRKTTNGTPASTWSASGTARRKTRRAHQAAMECVPDGHYEALAVAPLAGGRLDPPDIALFYATPGAMIYFINGLQWSGYKRFDWSVVGESACANSWGRALKTREPSLSIPCFAERRYGGVLDDEMLMALPRPTISRRRSPAWRRWPRTDCAIPSRNTGSSRMCAPAWRSAIPAKGATLPRRDGEGAQSAHPRTSAQSELPIEIFDGLALLARMRSSGQPGKIGRQ